MPMRSIPALCLLLAGCAAAPEMPAPAAVLAQTEAAPSGAADNPVDTVQEARKAGYRIVNEGGKTLYCREQLKTGSHLRKETICLTEEELEIARDTSRRNMEQMQRRTPLPRGN
jgi:hypothetical protein